MIHADGHNFPYYTSLEEPKEDGYTVIKVWNLLQFFTLAGRRNVLTKTNLIPIPALRYAVLNGDKHYYVREFNQNWTVDMVYFYRKSIDFSGEDTAIENLRRYVDDRRLWLILTSEQIEQTKSMLARVYKGQFHQEGKLDYKLYIQILELSLKLEDYEDWGKHLTGFKTACKILQDHILELWKKAKQ